MSTPPPASPRRRVAGGSRWPARRIVLAVVALYAVLLALLNIRSVAVNFVFFKASASLFVVIALSLGIGFLAGWLFDDLRARRRGS